MARSTVPTRRLCHQGPYRQREIPHEAKIFRLFFEERFQFAARLSPTFLGGGVITATSCAQPN